MGLFHSWHFDLLSLVCGVCSFVHLHCNKLAHSVPLLCPPSGHLQSLHLSLLDSVCWKPLQMMPSWISIPAGYQVQQFNVIPSVCPLLASSCSPRKHKASMGVFRILLFFFTSSSWMITLSCWSSKSRPILLCPNVFRAIWLWLWTTGFSRSAITRASCSSHNILHQPRPNMGNRTACSL